VQIAERLVESQRNRNDPRIADAFSPELRSDASITLSSY